MDQPADSDRPLWHCERPSPRNSGIYDPVVALDRPSHNSTVRSGPHRPAPGPGRVLHASPETVGWRNLEFAVVDVVPGAPHRGVSPDRETAIVTLQGAGTITGGGVTAEVSRTSVFEEVCSVVYLPPGAEYAIECTSNGTGKLQVAIGSAPAEGLLPARCIEPWEMRTEIRGGGQSHRQVVHTLSHPLPAERLIVLLFAIVVAAVLQQHDLARLDFDPVQPVGPQRYRATEQLGQALGHRRQQLAPLGDVLLQLFERQPLVPRHASHLDRKSVV